MSNPNIAGVQPLPNEIQNTQTTTGNFDASHIICNADGTISVKGTLVFDPPGGLNQIVAQDNSCSVVCSNGGDITQSCNNQYFNIGSTLQYNGYTSSQYFICYGQSKGENVTQEMYHIPFPDADVAQPDFNLRMFGYPDFHQWFDNDSYNTIDNNFIQQSGDGFIFVCPTDTMVEIDIVWQLRYTFDGTAPASYFACGLFNVDNNEIVPQSLTWQVSNDVKHKYQTFRTSFTMRTNGQKYFPFFQQQDVNQWTDTEVGGRMRSSIRFKFYQFITY